MSTSTQLRVAALALRKNFSEALTQAQMDGNFEKLRDHGNALAAILETALNSDGTLKEDAVVAASISDRVVSQNHLALDWLPVLRDIGIADEIAVELTPYPTAIAELVSPVAIYVKADNTGPVHVKFRDAADSYFDKVLLVKRGGLTLEAGDLKAGEMILIAYDPTSETFQLISGGGGNGPADSGNTNFTAVTRYESANTTIPVTNATESFLHALNAQPEDVGVDLVCTTTEHGYAPGQRLSLDQFFDASGAPAFGVEVSTTTVSVTRHAATIYVQDKTTGTQVALAETGGVPDNWELVVRAYTIYDATPPVFPALEFTLGDPQGVISYGNNLYWFNYNNSAAKSYVGKTVLGNLNASVITTHSGPVSLYHNPAPWRTDDGAEVIAWFDNRGGGKIITETGTAAAFSALGSAPHEYKLCWMDESGAGGSGNPDLFGLTSNPWFSKTLTALRMLKWTYSGSAYTQATFGTDLDLTNGGIVNLSAFTAFVSGSEIIRFCQYNPVKRRLYVLAGANALLHIFNLDLYWTAAGEPDRTNVTTWWAQADVTRYAQLAYEKALMLSGPMPSGEALYSNNIAIDFDLATGQEKAVCWAAPNGNQVGYPGTVVRMPWRE